MKNRNRTLFAILLSNLLYLSESAGNHALASRYYRYAVRLWLDA